MKASARDAACPQRGQDVEQEVEITLEEAFRGAQRIVSMWMAGGWK